MDGTICASKREGQTYAEVAPLPGAVEALQRLKAEGHYLIIYTARHMRTCEGNVALVIARQGKVLLDWLEQWRVPYDELLFGKPHADVFIDDKAFEFRNWSDVAPSLRERFNE